MKTTALVGEKGQVTIPKALRKSLGIRRGTELRFEERGGTLVATRVDTHDPIVSLVGLGERVSTDAFLAGLRGPTWNAKLDGKK